jgi:hypothetical protein
MSQKVKLLLIALSCFYAELIYAQTPGMEKADIDFLRTVYVESLSEQSGLYDGPEYTGYPYPLNAGQPFFKSDSVTRGTIFYKGLLYGNVPMRYDLVKNEVVVEYDRYSKISLHSPKVSYFSLHGHHFIRIDSSAARINDMEEGFYDQIYKGRVEVLVKRSKGMLRTVSSGRIGTSILKQKNQIYLIKDGRYFPVSGEASAFKVLGATKAREIQGQLKKSRIKFRKKPEEALVLMASLFDQSNK